VNVMIQGPIKIVIEIDGSHDPKDLGRLLAILGPLIQRELGLPDGHYSVGADFGNN
jgi:hypothetical protein